MEQGLYATSGLAQIKEWRLLSVKKENGEKCEMGNVKSEVGNAPHFSLLTFHFSLLTKIATTINSTHNAY